MGITPTKSDRNNISYTWSTIEAFLDDCEVERQPVSKLYKRLEEPPIGLRSGPMPILLCAVLLHYEAGNRTLRRWFLCHGYYNRSF